jgi:hypothetical protein
MVIWLVSPLVCGLLSCEKPGLPKVRSSIRHRRPQADGQRDPPPPPMSSWARYSFYCFALAGVMGT